ncbi:hypothetical protein [Alcanivorax quisquiliarum]|uniref:Uncharacterized protein n=1 Tax=Alcanivorax quisquiliarum TaxID=2933565 RepID=A0ABT0E6F7_9GAMM|nr:hypothetical protein [Alcanivorax quisquiliarum]MCK0537377.1 hypothetical protein [Alcanivorax quisquiliarum]
MSSPYHPMQLVFGLAIWAVWFVMIYAGLSIACEHLVEMEGGTLSWVNLVLMAFTMLTCGLLLFLAHRTWRDARPSWRDQSSAGRFIVRTAVMLNLVAALVTLAVGLPVVMLPPCL